MEGSWWLCCLTSSHPETAAFLYGQLGTFSSQPLPLLVFLLPFLGIIFSALSSKFLFTAVECCSVPMRILVYTYLTRGAAHETTQHKPETCPRQSIFCLSLSQIACPLVFSKI